jgi:hypothetical protein
MGCIEFDEQDATHRFFLCFLIVHRSWATQSSNLLLKCSTSAAIFELLKHKLKFFVQCSFSLRNRDYLITLDILHYFFHIHVPSTTLTLDLMETLNRFFGRACHHRNASSEK